MWPRVDFTSYYKFIVSLALLLVAIAVALPIAVLRDDGALRMRHDDMLELTPLSAEMVERQQQHKRWLLGAYPYISGALGLAGIGLAIHGLTRWRTRQNVLDDIEDTKKETALVTLQRMTDGEIAERRVEEAAELAVGVSTPEAADGTGLDVGEAEGRQLAGDVDRIQRAAQKAQEVEAAVAERLHEAFGRSYEIISNVRLQAGDVAVAVDFFLRSKSPNGVHYVVDVKYSRAQERNAARRMRDAAVRLAQAAATVPGQCRGVALMIVEGPGKEGGVGAVREVFTKEAKALQQSLQVPVSVSVLALDEFNALSAEGIREIFTW